MIIPVTDDYRIDSDEHAWMVQRIKRYGPESKLHGQEVWRAISWHPTLASAAESLSQRLWRVCEPEQGETLVQALERLDEVVAASVRLSEAWRLQQ